MNYIDMHCDTLMLQYFTGLQEPDMDVSPSTHIDFSRMAKTGQMAQFFAAFLPSLHSYEKRNKPIVSDEYYLKRCYEILQYNVKKYSDKIAMAYSAEDIEKNFAAGKMSAVFTMEDGRSVNGKLENLKRYYEDYGVRCLALTWNFYNCFGAPNSPDPVIMHDGLTAFGREAVAYMQELGMLVDVSHLSEGGFWDVAAICRKPFVATHSNCRALCPHQRNLSDDQLRALAKAGGVAGLNLAPEFLSPDVKSKDSRVEDMCRMVQHVIAVAGEDTLAIGTDFDGIGGNLEIGGCDQMILLDEALEKAGISSAVREKMYYKNVLRVLKEAL